MLIKENHDQKLIENRLLKKLMNKLLLLSRYLGTKHQATKQSQLVAVRLPGDSLICNNSLGSRVAVFLIFQQPVIWPINDRKYFCQFYYLSWPHYLYLLSAVLNQEVWAWNYQRRCRLYISCNRRRRTLQVLRRLLFHHLLLKQKVSSRNILSFLFFSPGQ